MVSAAMSADDQRGGVLFVAERTRLVAVEVEGAETNGADLEGKPHTASAPALITGPLNPIHREMEGSARSGSRTGRPWWYASTQGPSPREYCSSSISALTPSVVHTEP